MPTTQKYRKLNQFFNNSEMKAFQKTSPINNPTRPGTLVRNMLIEIEVTVTDASTFLNISRQTLNNLINNNSASISPEMALRLEMVFGFSADAWLQMQANYNSSQVRKREEEIKQGLTQLQFT